ncbi:MAG: type II toxin-antitoxin system VapC family toxin [Methylacidiphilales bacterium]|nr:type II toxin-antitoxin system VapC family toxin [Candidatus Methylacidiphilales bacterium]
MTTLSRYVVDTSVCIKHFISDPLTPKVNQLFDHFDNPSTEIFVPDLFYIECANVFWKYVRAGMYSAAEVQADLMTLKSLRFHMVSTVDFIENVISIAIEYNISAYDASYVALSRQVNATLLTLDQKLVRVLADSTNDVQLFNDFEIPPLP